MKENWFVALSQEHKDFTVKGLKTWNSREGGGFQGTLYYKGQKAAYFNQAGMGGPMEIDYTDKSIEKVITDYCKAQPPIPASTFGADLADSKMPDTIVDDEMMICAVLDRDESLKKLKKDCRKKTVLIPEEATAGQTVTFAIEYSPLVKEKIIARYPKYANAAFVNELITARG